MIIDSNPTNSSSGKNIIYSSLINYKFSTLAWKINIIQLSTWSLQGGVPVTWDARMATLPGYISCHLTSMVRNCKLSVEHSLYLVDVNWGWQVTCAEGYNPSPDRLDMVINRAAGRCLTCWPDSSITKPAGPVIQAEYRRYLTGWH